jgi:hypothetical protein
LCTVSFLWTCSTSSQLFENLGLIRCLLKLSLSYDGLLGRRGDSLAGCFLMVFVFVMGDVVGVLEVSK